MSVMAEAPLALERVVLRRYSDGLHCREGDFGTISVLTVMDCVTGITIHDPTEVVLVALARTRVEC